MLSPHLSFFKALAMKKIPERGSALIQNASLYCEKNKIRKENKTPRLSLVDLILLA
uniref:Uncharacterized protein n=1 Tax=Anguilla anguilla TaxID=7936 RepID=A0A0E9VZW9_ANGAN